MGAELVSQRGLQLVDGLLSGHEDPDQPADGNAVGVLDAGWLPQRGGLQVGKDLLDQRGVVAAAGPAQQRHQPGPSQLLPGCRGRQRRPTRSPRRGA